MHGGIIVNREFVCTQKESVVPDFRYNPGISLEAMRKLWGNNYFVRFGVFIFKNGREDKYSEPSGQISMNLARF